jgi:hypothetical protein
VYPGQVQLAPQPQYAPAPQQQPPTAYATGFPNYRPPAPSPKNRTGLIVGSIVTLLVAALAVVGFLIVSGRGTSSAEGAVRSYVNALNDRDAQAAHDLLCNSLADQVAVSDIESAFALVPGSGDFISDVNIGGSEDATVDGQSGKNVDLTATVFGDSSSTTVFAVDEDGWKVCGGDITDF